MPLAFFCPLAAYGHAQGDAGLEKTASVYEDTAIARNGIDDSEGIDNSSAVSDADGLNNGATSPEGTHGDPLGSNSGNESSSIQADSVQTDAPPINGGGGTAGTSSYDPAHVSYAVHAADIGWMPAVSDGVLAGTTGQSRRLEAICLSLGDLGLSGSIVYNAHVQDIGWQCSTVIDQTGLSAWFSNNDIAGTTGQSRRIEAIQIALTGDVAGLYDVYYRVHASNVGWMGWAKNGEKAGTTSYGHALEALEVLLVAKDGGVAPDYNNPNSNPAYLAPRLYCAVHAADIGWMQSVSDGVPAGTTGQSRRIEALRLSIGDIGTSGSIAYNAHVQDIGWQYAVETDTATLSTWFSDGDIAGTTGEAKRIEAVQIALIGDAADIYDVYYRVHAQDFGWLDWACNGQEAGTVGLSKRLEAIEVVLVAKDDEGTTVAPGDDTCPYFRSLQLSAYDGLCVQGLMRGSETLAEVGNGSVVGIANGAVPLDRFSLRLTNSTAASDMGQIQYMVYGSHRGWTDWSVYEDGLVGADAEDINSQLERVKIALAGKVSVFYDVYYRAFVRGKGWLGWAKNGQVAGSVSQGLQIEALQVMVQLKGEQSPGSNEGYLLANPEPKALISRILVECDNNLEACYRYTLDNFTYRARDIWPDYNGWEEDYCNDMLSTGTGNCYSHACVFCALAQELGYDAKVVKGGILLTDGNWTAHGWVEVQVDDIVYICDPGAQYQLTNLDLYMKQYDEAALIYRQ